MCGILFMYGGRPIDRIRFDAARDTMIHRGPDAQNSVYLEEGRLALGHTRLSIIDLSSRAHQPMRDGNLWVTFNGEIYNHPELRRELESHGCVFKTTSDTEVLLHGYRRWGEGLCARLTGMFAFGIWDDAAKRAFFGRDHFGQKPLYYAEVDGAIIAASEIKAIRTYIGRGLNLRRESVIDAMVQDFVAEPHTWYTEISVLPAGHQMAAQRTSRGSLTINVEKYWRFTPNPDPVPVMQASALDRLGEEVDRAMRAHLIADVEIGAFLSGGIDSTAIATLASSLVDQPIRTFSIGFGGDDELPIARETARRLGTLHREGTVLEQDYHQAVGSVLDLFDHPFTDTSLVPMERVAALAARDVKVVLTGDGGDECFGGYDYGKYLDPRSVPDRAGVPLSERVVRWLHQIRFLALGGEHWAMASREQLFAIRQLTPKRTGLIHPELLADVGDYDPSWPYRQHSLPELDPFRHAQWIGIKVPLPNKMLVKVDRCAMAHSLETRAPFLTPSLVEFVLDLPTEISNPNDCWFKGLFRRWLIDKVPQDILEGRKRGFSAPKHWSPIDTRAVGGSQELLPNCVAAGLVRPGAWRAMREMDKHLWRFAQLERALEDGLIRV